MAVCNLFSELKNASGNFLMFSQYVEDVTQNYVAGDNWKVVPTKFVAFNIDYSKLDDVILSRDEDLNTSIPKYFQNCFENACAYGREYYEDFSNRPWSPEISRNLFWNSMFDGGFLHPIKYGDTKIIDELVYFDDIHMHSFNDHKGMGYGEIYCYIPTDAAKKRSQVICITDSDPNGRKCQTQKTPTTLEGHTDRYVENFPQNYYYNRDFSMSFDDDSIGNILDDTANKYDINTIVVLYDVFKKVNDTWESEYSCIPLGLYFTGMFEGTKLTNVVTKYTTTSYGTGTSYGLRICTRFSVSHANGIVTDIISDDSNYTNTAQLMTAMNANLSKMLDVVKSSQDTSNQYKDLLSIFKNNKTNVPYVKNINGTDYWFVNGKFVSVVGGNTTSTNGCFNELSERTVQTRIDNLEKLKLDDDPTNDYSDYNFIEDPNGCNCNPLSLRAIADQLTLSYSTDPNDPNYLPDYGYGVVGGDTPGVVVDVDYATDEDIAGLLSKEWSYPVQLVNNSNSEVKFATSTTEPDDPMENDGVWFDYYSEDSNWLAIRTALNNIWLDWSIKRIKEEQNQEKDFYESVIFTRSTEVPPTPSGGTFENPLPSNEIWTDGIPTGEEPIWMSYRVFYNYVE